MSSPAGFQNTNRQNAASPLPLSVRPACAAPGETRTRTSSARMPCRVPGRQPTSTCSARTSGPERDAPGRSTASRRISTASCGKRKSATRILCTRRTAEVQGPAHVTTRLSKERAMKRIWDSHASSRLRPDRSACITHHKTKSRDERNETPARRRALSSHIWLPRRMTPPPGPSISLIDAPRRRPGRLIPATGDLQPTTGP
jgi:hypothetical protein